MSPEGRTTRFDAVGTDPQGHRVGIEIEKAQMSRTERFRKAAHFELQGKLSRPQNPFSDIERIIRHFLPPSSDSLDAQHPKLSERPWVLVVFYTFENLRRSPYPQGILNLVRQVEVLHPDAKFKYYAGSLYCSATSEEYRDRFRSFALSRHRGQMEKELSEGQLRNLMLFDWNDTAKSSITCEIRHIGEPEANQYDPSWIDPNWVAIEVATSFLNESEFLERILEFGKQVFTALKAAYGYIDSAQNPHDLLSIHMGQLYMHYKELWDEIETWKLQQRYCETVVKKAFWGNFLNAEHVHRLDSFERIKKEVPYEIIEPLPEGGACLIASRHPADKERPEVAQRIAKLQTFLKPILMRIEPVPPRHPKPSAPS